MGKNNESHAICCGESASLTISTRIIALHSTPSDSVSNRSVDVRDG